MREEEIEDIDGINVTPLVNLSLVLLMVFLVTSPYFIKDLIPVNLPQAVAVETESQENVTISVSPVDGFAVNETRVNKNQLGNWVKDALENSQNRYVLIRADERVPHGEIEDIMKLCKRLQVRKIAFATLPK